MSESKEKIIVELFGKFKNNSYLCNTDLNKYDLVVFCLYS